MRRTPSTPSPEVRALLDREREIPPQPAAVRARALARARAALATGEAAPAAEWPGVAPRRRWAAVAAMICIVSAAVGAAAYEIRARLVPPEPTTANERLARRPILPLDQTIATPPEPDEAIADAPAPQAQAQGAPRPSTTKADAARAELHLLRQARAAVARGDFAAALPPVAEHARRFKDGRLAEEREALRVKALAGLGRTEEARRAAASFQAHFPRSVLLPAVRDMPASGP